MNRIHEIRKELLRVKAIINSLIEQVNDIIKNK